MEADAERPRFYPVRLPAEASAPPTLRLVVNALVADPLQLPLFPEKERPVSCLAHFAGHVLPAAVAAEVEARRRWRGLTQAQVAEQIGISRPQLVNALKGRFPVVAMGRRQNSPRVPARQCDAGNRQGRLMIRRRRNQAKAT